MSVTLKNLARACGVSVGTVSRALNGKKEVSGRTAERIKRLAQELGYVPNRAGRALSAQKNLSCIGVLLPSVNSPFFDEIKRGIRQAKHDLKDLGIEIMLLEVEGYNPEKHLEALNKLEARGCKAMVLTTANVPAVIDKINDFAARKIPVILLNIDLPGAQRICYVGPDYHKSGEISAAMLDMCRHGEALKIMVAIGPIVHRGHHERVEGFKAELKRRKVDFAIVKTIIGMDNDIVTQQMSMEALREHPEINCIYMASGAGVSGLGAAIIADRSRSRFVIACDEIYTTRELVRNDIINFVITQQPFEQGYQAIKKMHSYISRNDNGEEADYIAENLIKIKNHFE